MRRAPQAERVLERGLRLRQYLDVCRRLVQTSSTYDGNSPPPALAVIRSLGGSVSPILVIDVGYNDDAYIYAAGVGQVMHLALAQGVRTVVWLTLRERGDYAPVYAATNAAIRRAARRWPHLYAADWNRASAREPWFADDVHPNDQGAVALGTLHARRHPRRRTRGRPIRPDGGRGATTATGLRTARDARTRVVLAVYGRPKRQPVIRLLGRRLSSSDCVRGPHQRSRHSLPQASDFTPGRLRRASRRGLRPSTGCCQADSDSSRPPPG